MNIKKINILSAILSIVIFIICCLIFIFRIGNQELAAYWMGIILVFTAIPLTYLLLTANQFHRPKIYTIQIGFMIAFLVTELLLDYIFKVQFRNTNWMVITYIMLFFAGTGGMIGVASHAGKIWTIIAVVLFLNMAALAFYQRAITGI
jgi:hypothetical protein